MTVSAEGGAGEAPKGTVIVLTDSFLSIKIIGFECSEGIFNRHVAYSIVVSCLGLSATVSKTYTQFQGLRQELERTAFRRSLPELPAHRTFANFDTVFLEQRRQQLETYLRMLATHSLVLLEGTLWLWLTGRSGLSQQIVRLAAASLLGLISEKYESIFALDAHYFSGSANAGSDSVTEPEMDFCLHAAVRDALCREIQEQDAGSDLHSAARRVLGRLLQHSRSKESWFSCVRVSVTNLAGSFHLDVELDACDSVAALQGRIRRAADISHRLLVRVAYNGAVMREDGSLYDAGVLPSQELLHVTAVISEAPDEVEAQAATIDVFRRNYGH
ncbi:unnamed protein product [Polarella glacialis]|uniref:PX domain-containing protein n=1 Tax=Polarella glacialis TaxID=89957 RepID=A0A813EBP4_POLGL|nr:unnamed protein product [Polarella glacialis]